MDFRLFGPVEAWVGGQRIDIGSARQRCVLVVLLLHANLVVTIDQLIDRTWGDELPGKARSVLYSYVSRLRNVLHANQTAGRRPQLSHRSGGYILDVDPEAIDLYRFQRLAAQARDAAKGGHDSAAARLWAQALGLWRCEPFANLGLISRWLEDRRDALETEHLRAILDSNDVRLRLGQHREILAELRDLVAANPFDTYLLGQLLLALYRSGRQTESIRHYENLRQRLKELGARPDPALVQLYTQILNHDPALNLPTLTERRSFRPTPAELPSDVPDFTGRTTELDWLATKLPINTAHPPPRAPLIFVIDGLPGIGKTALAVHFAHRIRDRYGDGQLYLDLRGFTPQQNPLSPSEALARLLFSLGVDVRDVPDDLDRQAGFLRTVTAHRRILFLLDNAVSTGQLRPLLPSNPGCLVIVTSRKRLDSLIAQDGARALTLGTLSPPEAITLLSNLVGTEPVTFEPDATDQLAALCGYLPLALRIVGAHLATQSRSSIAEFVGKFAEEHHRLDTLGAFDDDTVAVRMAFHLSYRALDDDCARAFRLLGLHAGADISTNAAAALLGTTPTAAERLLNMLRAVNLVDNNARDRYRFHDLVRLYAGERSEAEDADEKRANAMYRVLHWYLETADEADRLFDPGRRRVPLHPADQSAIHPALPGPPFDTATQALAWCQTEHRNLVAATGQAFDTGQYAIAWKLPMALFGFFHLHKPWADWITTHKIGLSAARTIPDRLGEAAMLTSLGIAHYDLRRYSQAVDYFEQALALWRRPDAPQDPTSMWGEAITLTTLGAAYRDLRRYGVALTHLEQALATWLEISDPWGESIARHNLGDTYRHLGHYNQAIDYLTQALTLRQQINAPHGQAWALHDLGVTYHDLGQPDKAIDYLHRALALRKRLHDRHGEARTLRRLGQTLTQAGQPDTAQQYAHQARAIFKELGDPRAADV